MKKIIANLIFFVSLLLLTSCNHALNIDTKLFVSAIGLDIGENKGVSICLSYPDISEYSPDSSKIKSTSSICGFGKSFYEALDDIVIKTNKSVDLEHVKDIILTENLINNKEIFQNILDYLSHDPQISRRIHISICKGNVKDFLDFKNPLDEHSQIFISELMKINSKENGLNLVTLNNMLDFFSQNKTIIIPSLKLNDKKDKMYISGSFVLENYNVLEEINLQETMFINFLRGDTYKILNEINYMEKIIDYEGENLKRKMKVLNEGDLSVVLNYNIKTLIKNCVDPEHLNVNNQFVLEVNEILDDSIKGNCITLINKFYKKNIDILNIENYIYKFNNNLWKEKIHNKNQWMKKLDVNLNINNNIINMGNISF